MRNLKIIKKLEDLEALKSLFISFISNEIVKPFAYNNRTFEEYSLGKKRIGN